MHSTWKTHQEFLEDIMAMSEMEGATKHEVNEPPPPTILEYRAQMAANNTGSIYDSLDDDEEGVTRIMSGRGRGGFSTILKPGISQVSDALIVEDVRKKIRQVSGLGYSNELIEQGVKAMTQANSRNKNSPVAARQTPQQLANPSKTSSPLKNVKQQSPAEKDSSSSCSSLHCASPTPVENTSPPPPLSVMRKQAQEQQEKKRQQASEKAATKEAKIKTQSPVPPYNKNGGAWRSSPSGSSSDEAWSWRRRDAESANRFFQPRPAGFSLNAKDFPALK